jgi:hypothetical protein
MLGVIQWVRRVSPNTEFAILASNPVTIPFIPKLYRKGGADGPCYSTASCKTEHWIEVRNVTNIEIIGKRVTNSAL